MKISLSSHILRLKRGDMVKVNCPQPTWKLEYVRRIISQFDLIWHQYVSFFTPSLTPQACDTLLKAYR